MKTIKEILMYRDGLTSQEATNKKEISVKNTLDSDDNNEEEDIQIVFFLFYLNQ